MRRLLALLCASALVIPGALPARAQTGGEAQAPTLRIAKISPFTDDTHPLSITVQVINAGELALQGARIRLTARARVSNRSELREALDGGGRRAQLRAIEDPVEGSIGPGGQATITVERPPAELGMTRSGVYPIEIGLRVGRVIETHRTAVPHFSSPPDRRLNVAWVLAVQRPSVAPIEGIYPQDTFDRLALTELTQQAEAIAARPDVPVTLAVSGSLLDTLRDLSDGFGQRTDAGIEAFGTDSDEAQQAAAALAALKRAASAAAELATAPYAPTNLPSLVARGLSNDVVKQIALGRSVVEASLDRAPATSTLVPADGQISRNALGALLGLGTTIAVIDQGAFPPDTDGPYRARDFGPSRPIAARATGPSITALMPDRPLATRLNTSEQGVLLAQAIVAETASSWHEMPLFAAERLLVIAGERLPAPTVLGAALDAFTAAPWITLRTMTEAGATTPALGDPVTLRSFALPDAPHLAAARAARRALATLQAILAGPLAIADRHERDILVAESGEWYREPLTGEAIGRAVAADVSDALSGVTVAPERRVTLTARSGEVPVTLVNANDFPVQVRVRLLSPRLGFPQGTAHTVAAFAGSTTVDVPVVARATGSYPVEVRVETPDGRRTLASGRIVLRTTAVSRVTLFALGGGALLLLLTGLRPGRSGTGRRKRSLLPSNE